MEEEKEKRPWGGFFQEIAQEIFENRETPENTTTIESNAATLSQDEKPEDPDESKIEEVLEIKPAEPPDSKSDSVEEEKGKRPWGGFFQEIAQEIFENRETSENTTTSKVDSRKTD